MYLQFILNGVQRRNTTQIAHSEPQRETGSEGGLEGRRGSLTFKPMLGRILLI